VGVVVESSKIPLMVYRQKRERQRQRRQRRKVEEED
jgi:hypothetical protein